MNSSTSKVIAACFALSAFTVAILAGMAANVPMAQVLWRAIVASLVCYPVGMAVGVICQRVISAHVQAHKAANPSPEANQDSASGDATSESDEEVITV